MALGVGVAGGVGLTGSVSVLALNPTTAIALFLVACGVLLMTPALIRLWRTRRGQPSRGTGIPVFGVRSRRSEIAEVERLVRDLRALTAECTRELDERAARLEALLQRAEAAGRRVVHQHDDTPALSVQPGIEVKQVGFAGAPGRGSPDPLAKQVYELADAGRSPVEIAGELDEGVGKVELILALRS